VQKSQLLMTAREVACDMTHGKDPARRSLLFPFYCDILLDTY
jgi:hypothetical protein